MRSILEEPIPFEEKRQKFEMYHTISEGLIEAVNRLNRYMSSVLAHCKNENGKNRIRK